MNSDTFTPSLSLIDIFIVLFYLVANAVAGFVIIRRNKSKTEVEEYILAGRTLTLPAFVATLVSTWYGGIIAVGEYVYDNGIVTWVVFGIPYYVAGLLFAFVLAKRVNQDTSHVSIPDRLRAVYGERAGYIGAVASSFMTTPAAYIMMLATLYQWYFGFSYWGGIVAAIGGSIVYLFYGGFRASIRADILQFVVMFVGFAVIVPFCITTYGGFSYLQENLPQSHLTPFGGFSVWYVVVWYIGAMTTLVDPNVHQRVFAAKSTKVATRGMVLSVAFWLLFDFMTNTAGLYAMASHPELGASKFAYPALAESILPIGLKGVFYTGILATVLSTVDSFFFTSATIIGHDILWRIWGKNKNELIKRFIRIGLIVTAVLSLGVIAASERIYQIWYSFSSILVPTLLLPLILSYFPRLCPKPVRAERAMLIGGGTSLVWYCIGIVRGDSLEPQYILGIEPMYIGLIASVLCLVSVLKQRISRNADI